MRIVLGVTQRFTLNEPTTLKLVYLAGDKSLSLLYHNNCSEFWKVTKGPVKVQLNEEKTLLQTGKTITIPKRAIHR